MVRGLRGLQADPQAGISMLGQALVDKLNELKLYENIKENIIQIPN